LTLAIFTGSPIVKKEKITSVKQFEITKQIPPNDDNYISTRYQNVIQESSNFQEKKIIVRHLKTEWSCFLKKQERDPCNFFRVKELKQTNDNFILF
jgi:hypothetical protein